MSSVASSVDALLELRTLLPATLVQDDLAAREAFAVQGIIPELVVHPQDAMQVAAILRHANTHHLSVVPSGRHTQQHIGNPPAKIDILLCLAKLESTLHYDAGDLTIGVGAGTRLLALQAQLAEHRQWLPFDCVDDQQTIGGVLATALQGPLRQHQLIRDLCIGIEFVTADGKIAHGGGRVVKNVAGYDLMKLLIGSFGTMGVITAASFKVLPAPVQTRTFVARFETRAAALATVAQIADSALAPLCFDLLSPRALEYIERDSHVRSADDYAPAHAVPLHADWKVVVRAAGSDSVLARYRRDLSSAFTEELTGDAESDYWMRITRIERRALQEHRNLMTVQVAFPPAGLVAALDAIESSAIENNLLPAIAARPTAGVGQVAYVPLSVDPPSAMQYASAVSALRAALPEGSSAVVLRCPPEAKTYFDVWGTVSSEMAAQRRLQIEFDPHRILNPGRTWFG